ncbi:MAG: hypothetical protein RJA07_1748 [Bacteroidota bacterium]
MKKIIYILLFVLFQSKLHGQGIGSGSDGSPNISGIINTYSKVNSINTIGCYSRITVDSILNFQPNDLVLIIQMQGATFDTTNTASYGTLQNFNSTGNFEFVKIQAIVGTTITLKSLFTKTYNTSTGKVQLIRVPQYNNPTITGILTCKKWNGTTGGVLALDAIGTVTLNDSLTVSSKGFRGALVQYGTTQINHQTDYRAFNNPSYFSNKGEGIGGYGFGLLTSGRGAPINGGGGGNSVNAGGGGGGNYGCGGLGGQGFNYSTYPGSPVLAQGVGGYGLTYNVSALKLFSGGGGGAGQSDDNQSFDGGDGGGIIIINANLIIGNNKMINANGNGVQASGIDGAAGGGGGGCILLNIQTYSGLLSINAMGGHGGNSANYLQYYHGPGGGGGGGVIIFRNASTPTGVSINVNGGLQGLCNGNNSLETDGCMGGILYNFSTAINYPLNSSQTLSICQNDTATLQLNSSAQYINWLPTTNLSCSNCVAPKAYPTSTTTYIVTDSVNHCFNRDTFIVKVNLKTFSTLSDSICQGNIFIAPSGKQYAAIGTYYDTIINHNSCDSIITIQLSACTNTSSHASFQFIDSFCTNYPISITNTSSNNVTNCWSFDSLNINGVKSSVNLGVLNSALNSTTAGTLVEDGGNYYLFITNSFTTDLIRCDLGTNPLNTIPLSTTIISNVLPGGHNEAVQFFKESGSWYAIVDGGLNSSAFMSRLNFGVSITNTSPTVIPLAVPVLGNWPHQLEIFKNGSNYIGFVVCRTNGDVQRVNFGTSITNTPTITTVYSSFNPSVGFAMEQENGNWYMMISTNTVPGDLRILNFGTNILNNAPTVTNLGNVGGMLDAPRAIKLFKSCNQLFGLVSSQKSPTLGYPGHIVLLNFQNGITSPITTTNLGNYGGNDDFWNMTSNTFWSNNAFHFFTFNPVDSNVTRIDIAPIGNTLPLSFAVNPSVQYSTSGNHNIQLLTNFGNINQSNFCNTYFSLSNPSSSQTISICQNDTATLQLNSSAQYINWNPTTNLSCTNCVAPKAYPSSNTTYIATDSVNHCFSRDTFIINVNSKTFAALNVSICQGNTYTLPSGKIVSTANTYHDTIPNHFGCDSIITINLSVKNKSTASVNTTICKGKNFITPSGKILVNAGVYNDTILNYRNCDSIITIQLQTKDSSLKIINAAICNGKNYTLPNGSIVNSGGNYTIKYTNYLGCDSTIIVQLKALNNTTVNQTIFICQGDTFHLSDGSITTFGGNYFSTIPNYLGCDSTIHTVINMLPKFKIDLGSDVLMCDDKTITLNANPNNLIGGSFSWNNGVGIATTEISSGGLYIVTATFPPCKPVLDSIFIVTENCDCNMYMPNAFSPNHDGLNETIKPVIECNPLPIDYVFSIYNRWGQLVFTTSNIDESWDGNFKKKEQEVGVYDYLISYKHSANEKKIIKKGDISLIR